jgi:hypothetical protein
MNDFSIREAIVGLSWWRMVEVRMWGRKPHFVPRARPLPASAYADICLHLWAALANPNQPMTADDRASVLMYAFLAYENLARGDATHESWCCTALNMYMGKALALRGYGPEYVDLFDEALDGMMRMQDRGVRTGNWRLDGVTLRAVGEALPVHEAQLELVPRKLIMEVHAEVQDELARLEREYETTEKK